VQFGNSGKLAPIVQKTEQTLGFFLGDRRGSGRTLCHVVRITDS